MARGLVAALFVALVIATWWTAREIAPESPAVAAIAPALVVTSPFVQLFAVQAMLEVPGALLYVLSLGAYARHLRTGTRATIVATGVLSAALFFTKYNYGLLWLAPLVLNEAWMACGGPRGVFGRATALARRHRSTPPLHVVRRDLPGGSCGDRVDRRRHAPTGGASA